MHSQLSLALVILFFNIIEDLIIFNQSIQTLPQKGLFFHYHEFPVFLFCRFVIKSGANSKDRTKFSSHVLTTLDKFFTSYLKSF